MKINVFDPRDVGPDNRVPLKFNYKKFVPTTYVAMILDCSGSMDTIKNRFVDCVNNQIRELRTGNKGIVKLTISTFSTSPNSPVCVDSNPSNVNLLNYDDYNPNGWTALYDAIGEQIKRFECIEDGYIVRCDCPLFYKEIPVSDKPSFLIIVVSDGEENYSKKYNSYQIREKIKELELQGNWTFTFLCSNVDIKRLAATLNIGRGNISIFDSTDEGITRGMNRVKSANERYFSSRLCGQVLTTDFFEKNKK